MKKIGIIFGAIFCIFAAYGVTETITWHVDNTTSTTTCESGGDIILPNTPTKYGYAFLGWRTNFKLIEYLESTGTQYIDTGFRPNDSTYLTVKFSINDYMNGGTTGCLSSWISDCNGVGFTGSQSLGLNFYFYGNNYLQPITLNTIYEVQLNAYKNNKYAVINGTRYDLQIDSSCANTSITSPSMTISKNTKNKLYYFQAFDNGTLVRDMVPVLDNNNIPCMYDKVSDQFFYNAGTGNFIAGPVISE